MFDLADNNPRASKTLGFASGKNLHGFTLYPGTAFFQNCDGHRVLGLVKEYGGGYTECNGPFFSSVNAKYYADHPKMKWVSTNIRQALSVPGIIKQVTSGNQVLSLARVNITTSIQQIGIYWINKGNCFIWDETIGKARGNLEFFEVLACSP
jgi:hypothetical protein